MQIFDYQIFKSQPIKKSDSIYPIPTVLLEEVFFLKLISNDGIVGYGEPSPYIMDKKFFLSLYFEIIEDHIMNRKITTILKNLNKIKVNKSTIIYTNIIIASLEQALNDILAKESNLPLYKFLNKKNLKKQKEISIYISGGMIFENQNYNILIDESIKAKEGGFKGWKFRPKSPISNLSHYDRIKKPPRFDIDDLIEFSNKLRMSVGNKFRLMVDFGKRINSIKQAKYVLDSLNELNFFFIEEPLKLHLEKYLFLFNSKNNVKIALGESFQNFDESLVWINNKLDIIQPDCNLMRISDINKLIKNSTINSFEIILHNWSYPISMMHNLHLAGSTNSIKLVEFSFLGFQNKLKTIKENISFKNGKVALSDEPGIGVTLNEKHLIKVT